MNLQDFENTIYIKNTPSTAGVTYVSILIRSLLSFLNKYTIVVIEAARERIKLKPIFNRTPVLSESLYALHANRINPVIIFKLPENFIPNDISHPLELTLGNIARKKVKKEKITNIKIRVLFSNFSLS
tara:strand:+ start:436 stop:819 length:384 start_codon:yes stop_codon:yes gene_type:complete